MSLRDLYKATIFYKYFSRDSFLTYILLYASLCLTLTFINGFSNDNYYCAELFPWFYMFLSVWSYEYLQPCLDLCPISANWSIFFAYNFAFCRIIYNRPFYIWKIHLTSSMLHVNHQLCLYYYEGSVRLYGYTQLIYSHMKRHYLASLFLLLY